jgi:UPF0176 protein
MFSIINFYKFFPFDSAHQKLFRSDLETIGREDSSLGGLVLISDEGINITVASDGPGAEAVLDRCRKEVNLSDTPIKRHSAATQPFNRFTIDGRSEIITYRGDSSRNQPSLFSETDNSFLSPSAWHEILSSGERFTLIDTRNSYEVALGTFRGAHDPQIQRFSELGPWLDQNPPPRDEKVLVFCTGGVRCEKVVVDLKEKGYEDVFQLHGGILAYLEQYPDQHFKGECFVFDHRVSVDQHLAPSKINYLCHLCGDPTTEKRGCDYCGNHESICDRCVNLHGKAACSKNCLYHLNLKSSSNMPSRE